MKKNLSCSCSKRIDSIQMSILRLNDSIKKIQNNFHSFKQFQLSQKYKQLQLDQTLLLDQKVQKITHGKLNIKNQLFPIHQSLYKLNQTVKQLQIKCSSIDSIKRHISMQTRIIDYVLSAIPQIQSNNNKFNFQNTEPEVLKNVQFNAKTNIQKNLKKLDLNNNKFTQNSIQSFKQTQLEPIFQKISSSLSKNQSYKEEKQNWSRLLEYSIQLEQQYKSLSNSSKKTQNFR